MTSLKKYSVKWDMGAKRQLRYLFDHIKYTSPDNAKLVKSKLLETARSLTTMPERYEAYPPMKNLPGNYRFKEVMSYLLIYDVSENEVQIVRIAGKLPPI